MNQACAWPLMLLAMMSPAPVVIVATTATPAAAAPAVNSAEAAAALVRQFQSTLLDLDRQSAGRSLATRFARFAPLVTATHDLDFMAQASLGGLWQDLREPERGLFTDAFARGAILDYVTRFRDTEGGRFRLLGSRGAPAGRVLVVTELVLPGQDPVRLDYLLHRQAEDWRIVNIFAMGVSELALQRRQHESAWADGGFAALMGHLEARIAALQERT
jgi:phospholipid transport system substrate-binding protein